MPDEQRGANTPCALRCVHVWAGRQVGDGGTSVEVAPNPAPLSCRPLPHGAEKLPCLSAPPVTAPPARLPRSKPGSMMRNDHNGQYPGSGAPASELSACGSLLAGSIDRVIITSHQEAVVSALFGTDDYRYSMPQPHSVTLVMIVLRLQLHLQELHRKAPLTPLVLCLGNQSTPNRHTLTSPTSSSSSTSTLHLPPPTSTSHLPPPTSTSASTTSSGVDGDDVMTKLNVDDRGTNERGQAVAAAEAPGPMSLRLGRLRTRDHHIRERRGIRTA